jgi:hypothetical protein
LLPKGVRIYVLNAARANNIVGWVRRRMDKDLPCVQIAAKGNQSDMESFIAKLMELQSRLMGMDFFFDAIDFTVKPNILLAVKGKYTPEDCDKPSTRQQLVAASFKDTCLSISDSKKSKISNAMSLNNNSGASVSSSITESSTSQKPSRSAPSKRRFSSQRRVQQYFQPNAHPSILNTNNFSVAIFRNTSIMNFYNKLPNGDKILIGQIDVSQFDSFHDTKTLLSILFGMYVQWSSANQEVPLTVFIDDCNAKKNSLFDLNLENF